MPKRPNQHRPSHLVGRTRTSRPESSTARGYGYRWQQCRRRFLLAHPLCECGTDCCPDGCGMLATDVDHKQRVTGPDDPAFWDEDNWQPLAKACHSRKTRREEGGG